MEGVPAPYESVGGFFVGGDLSDSHGTGRTFHGPPRLVAATARDARHVCVLLLKDHLAISTGGELRAHSRVHSDQPGSFGIERCGLRCRRGTSLMELVA